MDRETREKLAMTIQKFEELRLATGITPTTKDLQGAGELWLLACIGAFCTALGDSKFDAYDRWRGFLWFNEKLCGPKEELLAWMAGRLWSGPLDLEQFRWASPYGGYGARNTTSGAKKEVLRLCDRQEALIMDVETLSGLPLTRHWVEDARKRVEDYEEMFR